MITENLWKNPVSHHIDLPYLRYLPADFDPDSEKLWPLVVFLHGAGERGDTLVDVYRNGPFRFGEQTDFPFLMVAPQCPNNDYWGAHIETLDDFLEDMLENLPVDRDRVYLTGLSMGGTGTWLWSLASPQKFAAILPVCGTGVYWYGEALRDVPVWAWHGDVDSVVPVQESVNMVSAVNKRGGCAKITILPGIDHDSWVQAYEGDGWYRWLLSHKKANQ